MPKISTGGNEMKSKSRATILRQLSSNTFKPSSTPFGGVGGCGDRLMLVHSDLSFIINQIDELVVQALNQKVRSTKEIESFTGVLHEMQTSLKPWIPRFKKVLSPQATGEENLLETSLANMKIAPTENKRKVPDSPNIDKFDFLVSPSPLVSWRADSRAQDGGRNLFLLTPLPRPTPFTSQLKKTSKSVLEKITNNNVTVKPVESFFSSPGKLEKKNDSVFVSTPYLKMSPPKSCVLLEPPSVGCNKINGTKKPTMPQLVGGGGFGESELSSSQPSRHLALKYPELFGIRTAHKPGNARKMVESSPNWCMSPPKTCILLDPSDDKTNAPKASGIPTVVSRNNALQSTPMCKEFDTTILKGKCAGENTLKKELWTRFEAATAHGLHLKALVDKEIANASGYKGFLDLLEEASCDDTNSRV